MTAIRQLTDVSKFQFQLANHFQANRQFANKCVLCAVRALISFMHFEIKIKLLVEKLIMKIGDEREMREQNSHSTERYEQPNCNQSILVRTYERIHTHADIKCTDTQWKKKQVQHQ